MSVPRISAPTPPGLRLVGLLVVVAGLFGMHGLAGHGVDAMDVVPGTLSASSSMAGSEMQTGSPPVAGHQGLVAIEQADPLGAGGPGHGGMDMGIAMMCVAILGAALLARMSLLRGERPWRVVRARPHQTRVMSYSGRGPASPSLMELSIQRC